MKGPLQEGVPWLLPAHWGQVRLEATKATVLGPGGLLSQDTAEARILMNFYLFWFLSWFISISLLLKF